jgi:hypothetical protein
MSNAKDYIRLKRDGSNLKDFPQNEPTKREIKIMQILNEMDDELREKRKKSKELK